MSALSLKSRAFGIMKSIKANATGIIIVLGIAVVILITVRYKDRIFKKRSY